MSKFSEQINEINTKIGDICMDLKKCRKYIRRLRKLKNRCFRCVERCLCGQRETDSSQRLFADQHKRSVEYKELKESHEWQDVGKDCTPKGNDIQESHRLFGRLVNGLETNLQIIRVLKSLTKTTKLFVYSVCVCDYQTYNRVFKELCKTDVECTQLDTDLKTDVMERLNAYQEFHKSMARFVRKNRTEINAKPIDTSTHSSVPIVAKRHDRTESSTVVQTKATTPSTETKLRVKSNRNSKQKKTIETNLSPDLDNSCTQTQVQIIDSATERYVFCCNTCGQEFDTKPDFFSHTRLKHNTSVFKSFYTTKVVPFRPKAPNPEPNEELEKLKYIFVHTIEDPLLSNNKKRQQFRPKPQGFGLRGGKVVVERKAPNPPTAYQLFMRKMRKRASERELGFTVFRHRMAEKWKALSRVQRDRYFSLAKEIRSKWIQSRSGRKRFFRIEKKQNK